MKLNLKNLYKYLIYISFIFLVVGLYKSEYLYFPSVLSYNYFIVSIIFVLIAYLFGSLSWQSILDKSGYDVDFLYCYIGMGLNIFTKYIPGKLWMVMGRSAYLSKELSLPLEQLSFISLHHQFIGLWTGLLFGAIGFIIVDDILRLGWLLSFVWAAITVFCFTNAGHFLASYLLKKIKNKKISLPRIPFNKFFKILPWFILHWLLLSISFYFFTKSISANFVPFAVIFCIPFSITIGILAFFSPGGIGVREFAISGYLIIVGYSSSDAATIAIATRIWMLIGETMYFVISYLLQRFFLKQKTVN